MKPAAPASFDVPDFANTRLASAPPKNNHSIGFVRSIVPITGRPVAIAGIVESSPVDPKPPELAMGAGEDR